MQVGDDELDGGLVDPGGILATGPPSGGPAYHAVTIEKCRCVTGRRRLRDRLKDGLFLVLVHEDTRNCPRCGLERTHG